MHSTEIILSFKLSALDHFAGEDLFDGLHSDTIKLEHSSHHSYYFHILDVQFDHRIDKLYMLIHVILNNSALIFKVFSINFHYFFFGFEENPLVDFPSKFYFLFVISFPMFVKTEVF